MEDLYVVDIMVEAVFEDMKLKQGRGGGQVSLGGRLLPSHYYYFN